MRRLNQSKQFPFLMKYIEYAMDWHPPDLSDVLTPKAILPGIGISFIIGLFVELLSQSFIGGLAAGVVTFLVYLLGMYGIAETRRARQPDPQREVRREAKQVAQKIAVCAAKKRLHRDLSIEVGSLFEEAARNWHRARTALESPYWRAADLPSHLRLVREQSLQAVDQGMQEILVLFATSVPDRPSNWSFGEVVDEIVGQDVFASRGQVAHISPFFVQGRSVAGKLLELADQVESVSRQLAGQELISGAPKPGSGLDATLQELRQIKQAEDELRQDIRG